MSPDPAAVTPPLDASDRAVLALVVVATLAHFVAVDSAPPGFFDDEAAIAAQAICVAQSGHELFGARWPMFAPLIADGIVTPLTLYGSALWSLLFGMSIQSFRLFAAACAVLGCAGLAYGGRDRRTALWLGALTLTSPWLFPLSRMFMDPIVGFACVGWMFGFHARGQWARFGAASALAATSYPPLRVMVALTWIVLLATGPRDRPRGAWTSWLKAAVTALVVSLPMLRAFARPEYRSRGQSLAIWNENFLLEHGWAQLSTVGKVAELGTIYLQNLATFFTPRFLLWEGDANLRHGIGVGALAWVELGALLWLIGARVAHSPTPPLRDTLRAALLTVAALSGAALTWEGLPHGLRAIGVAAPLALWTADVVVRSTTRVRVVFTALLWVGSAWYGVQYATRAPTLGDWFQERVVRAVAAGSPVPDDIQRPARDYYELASGRSRCEPAP